MDGMRYRDGELHMLLTSHSRKMGVYVLCVVLLAMLSAATSNTNNTKTANNEVPVISTVPPTTQNTTSNQNTPTLISTVSVITQEAITTSPESLPSLETSFANVTLRKCRCERNEVWSVDRCVEKITVVPCYGSDGPFARNTSAFKSVSIGEATCKDGYTPVPLFTYEYLIFIQADGTLLWANENMVIEDYCIEHVEYDGGFDVMKGQVCVPPPPVPQCCPPGYMLGDDDGDDSCYPDTDGIFTPPVYVSSYLVQWEGVAEDVVDITCPADKNVTLISLSKEEGWLLYSHQKALLHIGSAVESSNLLDYCVSKRKGSDSKDPEYIAKLCMSDPTHKHQRMCGNTTCVRKCCGEGFLLMNATCVEASNAGERWQPFFHDHRNLSAVATPEEDWTVVYGPPLCSNFFSLVPKYKETDKFYLLTNGSLHVPLFTNSFASEDYCMDLNLDEDFHVTDMAIICGSELIEECRWKQTLITVLRGVSCVFLAATVLIYLGVPELRDRTNGRCLVSMAVAMIASHLSIIVVSEVPHLNDTECFVAAFVGHVNTLATFFWLNVMCFDMWTTLRSSQQQYHSLKVFTLYSVYAWGCPLLVGLVGLVLDIIKPAGVIRPKFSESTCWFTGNAEFWTYLSGIILVLVVINLCFFAHVAVLLSQKLKQRKAMVFETDKSSKTKEQVWLYVKLFIVMGVMWITDIFSSLHDRNECKYWVVTDIINALQGVFIFLVAICNKDNLRKIRSAWHPRVQRIQKSMLNLRRGSGPANHHSLSASDASRKTSITSIPRKLSAVSNHFIGNRNRGAAVLNENEERKKSLENSPSNKLTPLAAETVPMSTLAE